ncbi:MAG: hypothetical protein ACHQ1H_04635, partial [Nitrososphaerales archaeon]
RNLTIVAPLEFSFENARASELFDFLLAAFVSDYMGEKMPLENSGWRTMGQMARDGKVPYFSVYGRRGGFSAELKELIRRGIVEQRLFAHERGRGGEITKLRVAYDRETVRGSVNKKIKFNG